MAFLMVGRGSSIGLWADPTAAPEATKPATALAVGVVLPTKDEPRWIQDETRFNDAFKAAGYEVQILFGQGDSTKEKANVEPLIAQGVKVIIICPQDATAAAAAAEEARAAGVGKIPRVDHRRTGDGLADERHGPPGLEHFDPVHHQGPCAYGAVLFDIATRKTKRPL